MTKAHVFSACLILMQNALCGCATRREPGTSWAVDLQGLFDRPVAIVDRDGLDIVTKRAGGHAVVFDWSGDGINDIILGCHKGMNTTKAEILMIENVGKKGRPKFKWPAANKLRLETEDKAKTLGGSCGCKSSGAFELLPCDWNDDRHFDIILNTYWRYHGVRVLLNTGQSLAEPTFKLGQELWSIRSHGKGSGGGDWNADGIPDYVHPVNSYGWSVYLGERSPEGGIRFEKKGLTSRDFEIVGHDSYPKVRDKQVCRWFDRTPYAWDFSGNASEGSGIVELIAIMYAPDYRKTKDYAAKKCHINYYELDTAKKTCSLKARLAVNAGATTRLSIGDINQDNSMDVIYTGGTFNKDGAGTKIWVLYGRRKNIF